MSKKNAVFGGEHSGHFYFRSFYGADTGMLAAMHVIAAVGESSSPLSEIVSSYDPYFSSGEVNVTVKDIDLVLEKAIEGLSEFWGTSNLTVDRLDGVTIDYWGQSPRWWVNLRPSNTEPVLRINIEAENADIVDEIAAFLYVIVKG